MPAIRNDLSTRITSSRTFKPGAVEESKLYVEWARLVAGPGRGMNLMSGKRLTEIRSKIEKDTPFTGINVPREGKASATDVKNPDAPDGKWDPYAHLPRFVFHPAEDAFPVSPSYDGDLKLKNNGPATPNGDSPYQDGFIGGDQKLSGAFTVTKKGDYTVLTYSFYYAHNKAVHYHANDYSTAQVYLRPGADGKLEPAYLATSWHHGSVLTPWKDLAKDKDGRPVVAVNLGSHALQPLGKGSELPVEGLQIRGDGRAELDGKPLRHRIEFDALQTNVKGANYLDPGSKEAKPRLKALSWGEAALNPFLPEVYESAQGVWPEMGDRLLRMAKKPLAKAWDAVASWIPGR